MSRVDSCSVSKISCAFAGLVITLSGVVVGCQPSRPAAGSLEGDGGAATADGNGGALDGGSDAGPRDRYTWWRNERASRRAALDAYLASNDDGLRALLYAPVGDFGIPRVTLENFSTVMPDIWGPPEEKFAAVGLGRDLHDPTNPLPLGIATFELAGAEVAIFSCGACHVGRVIGPSGDEELLLGAPNTRFDAVFTAFEDTAADPRFGDLGGGAGALAVKEALLLRRSIEERTIGGFTFDRTRNPTAPDPFSRDRRGFFDSFAVIFAMQTLPEALLPGTDSVLASIMPPVPGEADIMSLWRQDVRPIAEWDGSLPNPVYRNLAASIGAIAFGALANYDTAYRVAQFSHDLPSPPYPFDVDGTRAARGATLFANHCAGCHRDGSSDIYPTSLVGTDPNRANSVSVEGRTRLIKALRASCTDATVCDIPDDQIVADPTSGAPLGYMALPLQGIWARAPYLHNGSVPTLRHLLVPSSRPNAFVRGSIHYDQTNVGFAWDATAAVDPYVDLFDTTRAGRSNVGHSSATFLGLDWASRPDDLADLLEYLKTL